MKIFFLIKISELKRAAKQAKENIGLLSLNEEESKENVEPQCTAYHNNISCAQYLIKRTTKMLHVFIVTTSTADQNLEDLIHEV